jgi:opacity protein-like surface antigen
MRSRFLFTAGIVGVLSSGVASRADVDYEREWNPYVTLRGGWLFGGKAKYNQSVKPKAADDAVLSEDKKSLKSAWSSSAEFGVALCEDLVSVGLELGYFTGKPGLEREHIGIVEFGGAGLPGGTDVTIVKFASDGRCKNFFGACNVTLKKDVGERAFLYGGVGAGLARTDFGKAVLHIDDVTPAVPTKYDRSVDYGKKWRFLGQAFGGLGIYLNEIGH